MLKVPYKKQGMIDLSLSSFEASLAFLRVQFSENKKLLTQAKIMMEAQVKKRPVSKIFIGNIWAENFYTFLAKISGQPRLSVENPNFYAS